MVSLRCSPPRGRVVQRSRSRRRRPASPARCRRTSRACTGHATSGAPSSRSRSSTRTRCTAEISSSRTITYGRHVAMMAVMCTSESLIRSFAPAATAARAGGRKPRALGVAQVGETTTALDRSAGGVPASSRSACRWSTGTEKKPCTCGECRFSVSTRLTPAVTSKVGDQAAADGDPRRAFLSDRAYA